MALFTLEALRAKHGDALILHFGDGRRHRLIVIDGGPTGVAGDALIPRLKELRSALAGAKPLRVEVLMISHIDDDHIRGILDLSEQFVSNPLDERFVEVGTLWHNAFDDLADDAAGLEASVARLEAQVAATGAGPSWKGDAKAVVASVRQGVQLKDNATKLGWERNSPFGEFVMAPGDGAAQAKFGDLRLKIVGPRQPELEKLRKRWREWVEQAKKGKGEAAARAAANLDRSVFNLSSIVCVAEFAKKTMLLTGDARGDHILAALEAAALLETGGKLEFDVLKLPHHGSNRNVDPEFFERLRARHYVVSGNGIHHNPEVETLEMLSAARRDDEFTLHLTYEDCEEGVGEQLARFFAAEKRDGRGYGVSFRDPQALSLHVDLLDELAV